MAMIMAQNGQWKFVKRYKYREESIAGEFSTLKGKDRALAKGIRSIIQLPRTYPAQPEKRGVHSPWSSAKLTKGGGRSVIWNIYSLIHGSSKLYHPMPQNSGTSVEPSSNERTSLARLNPFCSRVIFIWYS